MKWLGFLIGLAAMAQIFGAAPASAATPLTIVIFNAPSLGAFLPPVIKAKHLDEANGLDISFPERTPDAYAIEFNTGEFELGGSGAVLTIGLADTRGVKTAYLFNLFDYWGAVVTQRPDIKTLADLKGKQLAAARGTTNYSMFAWFAQQKGLSPDSFTVVNTATPGLVGYALADRADAVQLWEPAYSVLISKKPTIRTLDLGIASAWQRFAHTKSIPYLGVAAQQSWIDKHADLIPPLYHTYKAAAAWVMAHPAEAAAIIGGAKADDQQRKSLENLIRHNTRLGMNVTPAAELKTGIEAVYRAGLAVGALPSMPSDASIYSKDIH
ncbi:MAG: ABC transporter substrate-binding protein [Alphaproteobacteria bacterium]|nr:ABC transporter substrate-binding protein [Alphaproteobacteria bacterium]